MIWQDVRWTSSRQGLRKSCWWISSQNANCKWLKNAGRHSLGRSRTKVSCSF